MAEECPKCKCPAGIPAWVLTFADLMSLLMCFFVLLLSFAEMDVQKYKQIAGSVKMAFGVQRVVKANDPPKGVNIIAKEFSPAPPQPTVINEVRQKTSEDTQQELRLVKKLEELEATENELSRKMGRAETEEEQEEIQDKVKQVQEEIEEIKKELQQVQSQIEEIQQEEIQEQATQMSAQLQKEIEEDLIEVEVSKDSFTIRIKDKGAFPPGSATLTDDFIDVLEVVKEELAAIKGGLIVAGHTDDIPISTRAFRSNWDLSAKRAVSVVQELLYDSEIDPNRISIQAFADSKPLVPNDSAENRSKNRRVEIVISKSKNELNNIDRKPKSDETADNGEAEEQKPAEIEENGTAPDTTEQQPPPADAANDILEDTRRPEPATETVPAANDAFVPDEPPSFISF